jgi:ATP-dependent exoDNAse (exonuclease V) beta subunit
MTSTKRFTIIKASAGSGKTFQLVLHYLSYALRFENPGYYKHILAITFTTAAAAEMKQRVLSKLRDIADGSDTSEMSQKLQQKLGISSDVLQARAAAAYTDMLHHYSKLSILTIDSFTHRLVRSFAKDLQLNNDFNIELNSQTLQEKAVDRMLEFIGQDELLTRYLHRYSSDLLDDGKTWNPREALIKMAREIFTEDGQAPLQKLEAVDLIHIQQEHQKLRKMMKEHESRTFETAESILLLLSNAGITKEDVPGKKNGYINGLSKYVVKGKIVRPLKTLVKLNSDRIWINNQAPSSVKSLFDPHITRANELLDTLFELLSEDTLKRMALIRKITDNMYTLGLIDRMNEYAAEIRTEENMVLLSDFHRMINAIIRGNDAPFIFERIGARYNHILVDEFQDTSKMQWMNLVPLIHNCLSEGHESLVVGDAKQSIYRWRSGYVEQFISLPELPPDFDMHFAEKTFEDNKDIVPLQTNYRSSQSVINFNNSLFPMLASKIPAYNQVYDEVIQEKNSHKTGYVRLAGNILLSNKDEAHKTFVKDELIRAVHQCLKDGFAPGDITILARTHKQGTKCAEMLREHDIKFTTAESALLIHSSTVRIVMGYFEFHLFPQRRFAAFDVIQSLASIHKHVSLADFIADQLNFKEYRPIDLNGFLGKSFGNLSEVMVGENVFHQAISLLRVLQIPIDNSVEYLLELIKQHCIGKNHDLHRFIDWWKEHKHKLSAAAANNPDAVQIMTVHKSKGLEFPVVIFPHFAEKSKSSDLWVNVPEDLCELPAAYIKIDSNSAQDNLEEDEEGTDLTAEITLEKKRRYLDEINALYVTCTRAVMRLYFIQEKGMSPFNNLLDATFCELFSEFKTTGIAEIGVAEPYSTDLSKAIPLFVPSLKGKEVLFPRLRLRSIRERDTPEILYGKLLHECFSLLIEKSGVEQIVERILHGRSDSSTYKARLLNDLDKILSDSTASAWFDHNATLLCEREIIAGDGTTLRPDRVIVRADRVVVVDYKTGKESRKHADQVMHYKNQLQNIYQLPVEGFLLYTEGPKIIAV